jgi:hypothetical protein
MDPNDYYFTTLNTISQLQEYDKLGLKQINNEVKLVVDKSSYVSFITRSYNRYDRLSVINHLKDFINKLEKYIEMLVKGHLDEYGKIIIQAIESAITGFNNLKITYLNDSNIVSEISLIIIKLQSFVVQLKDVSVVLDYVNDTNIDETVNNV